jgi:hypothetical protein
MGPAHSVVDAFGEAAAFGGRENHVSLAGLTASATVRPPNKLLSSVTAPCARQRGREAGALPVPAPAPSYRKATRVVLRVFTIQAIQTAAKTRND